MQSGTALVAWENFYVIMGSAAAALTGLQFVVLALIAQRNMRRDAESVNAFGTPTVVHFGAVLLLSAIQTAAWPSLSGVACAIGVCGCSGLGYGLIVLRRATKQTLYQMVFEDWIWHVIFPFGAYATLLIAAAFVQARTLAALFAIGAVSLLLLFIGIHNAWDTVTYIAVGNSRWADGEQAQDAASH